MANLLIQAAFTVALGAVHRALTPDTVIQQEEGRLEDSKISSAAEGAAIAELWGRQRVPGQVMWATKFREVVDVQTTTQSGGKGGGGPDVVNETTSYRYFQSFAIGLCQANGARIRLGRIWADGIELDQSLSTIRFYDGSENQTPDSLIAATEGDSPAYKGIAYLVFDDFEVTPHGNRIPQFTFEVTRSKDDDPDRIEEKLEAVTMIPGANEYIYGTQTYFTGRDEKSATENVSQVPDTPDLEVSLDQLEDDVTNIASVELVVAWFGDDLRCGNCEIKPKIDFREKVVKPVNWRVSSETRSFADLVSKTPDGKVAFGGTPADITVREALTEIKSRGHRAVFYPFIMMDVETGNSLPNPYSNNAATNGQAVYPWRGRVTCSPAAGFTGTVDKTAGAQTQVNSFIGTAAPSNFAAWNGTQIAYTGPSEWSFRRMVLHYAKLCSDVMTVGDAFIIGTEMVGMTTVRSSASNYPFVNALVTLLADVKTLLPAGVKVSYAADWSEYHSHRPDDGTNDVYFNMDPLWNVADFIGIDNYLPLTDWRTADEYDYRLSHLMDGVEGREYYDYFYASDADRLARTQTAITDEQYGEAFTYRQKDMKNWWQRTHHDRPSGEQDQLYSAGDTPDAWGSGVATVASDANTFGTYSNAATVASAGSSSDYANGSDPVDGIVSGEQYEFGAIIKPGTSNQCQMFVAITGQSNPQIRSTDITGESITNQGGTCDSVELEALSGGFYRVSGVFTATVTDATTPVRLGPNSSTVGEDVIVLGAWMRCISTATSVSTDWVPESKPIWFTEFGCAAIDKGANQPNVFLDPKSSESFKPHFSTGARDDLIQRRYLEAWIKYWATNSPVGMIAAADMFAWTWDARPFPNFPYGEWGDRDNWRLGHWLNGRLNIMYLKDIVRDLASNVGLTDADFDFTGLDKFPVVVRGHLSTSIKTPREIIETLSRVHHAGVLESEGVIKLYRKRLTELASFDAEDLISQSNNPGGFEIVTGQETDVPAEVVITFADESNGFQSVTVNGKRQTGNSQLIEDLRTNTVIEPEEGRNLAEEMLNERSLGRQTFKGSWPRDILKYDPGDMFDVTLRGRNTTFRIDELTIGLDVAVEAGRADRTIYTPRSVVAPLPTTGSGILLPGSALVEFIDIPLTTSASLRPWAPRIVAHQNPWPGQVSIYEDDGSGGYTEVNKISTPATLGETTATFTAGKLYHWDNESALTVRFYSGTTSIISLSDQSVLNGSNTVAVETSSGWELVQYRTATLVSGNTYTLTGLLRGQNGTEYAMDANLAAGARVVFVNAAWGSLNVTQDQLNIAKTYRYGPTNVTVGDNRYTAEVYTPTGRSLMPFEPVHLKRKTSGADHVLQWVRRSRLNADSWNGTIPLNEENESYEVDILDGTDVKRTIEVADATSVTYTSAQQTTDFGSPQSRLKFNVYQISATIGRGQGANYDDT